MAQKSDIDPALAGLRVLVVEDSFLVAASLKSMLTDMGCQVLGPAPTVREAMRIMSEPGCDAAILDINLGKESAEPIAAALHERKTPFFFVTGYTSPKQIGVGYSTHPKLMKPIDRSALRTLMIREFKRPG